MDQHFPSAASQGQRGVEVVTAQQAGRCGLPDPDQLAFATSEERVMVSFDSDFLALHRSGVAHADIVWCPQQKYGIGMLVQLLELLHKIAERGQMRNHVEYL
jgi:hypothetical protein